MTRSALLDPLFSDPAIAAIFSDEHFIADMLRVEVALAKVQAALGVIPGDSAEAIAQRASTLQVDMQRLQTGIDNSGVPTIDLIQQLREQVGGEAAAYVHWGATTQDIMDTALVLQIRAALEHVESHLRQLITSLAGLADQHRGTLMAGRTHSQQALPITFGFKVAGWLAPLLRDMQRLNEMKPRLLVVQLGGAVGTLASLEDDGPRVQAALADELGLHVPLLPWHTQRDTLAELAGWCSLLTGSLAKMAQDVILMAQSEVAELHESDDPARGGSSTMPQKSNPIISEVIIAAARTNAALLSSMHQALIQEHERATGGWQMEWLALPQMIILTGAALNKAAFLGDNLVVDAAQMRRNVKASNGLMLAEALNLALAPIMGRSEAKQMIKAACSTALEQKRHLVDVVREQTDAELDWDSLRDEAHYLGASDTFIDRVLQEAERTVV